MAKDWIERKDASFATQAKIFCDAIAADYAAYHISPADAALLADDHADFAARYALAQNPVTRTRPAVAARQDARRQLADRMRALAARIRADSSIAVAAKMALTLTVPGAAPAAPPARPAPPDARPNLFIRSIVNNLIHVRLIEPGRAGFGKPRHITGAQVLFALGAERPQRPDAWRPGGLTTSSQARIAIPGAAAGAKVWLAARWFNAHGAGPLSDPIYTHLGSVGSLSEAA